MRTVGTLYKGSPLIAVSSRSGKISLYLWFSRNRESYKTTTVW